MMRLAFPVALLAIALAAPAPAQPLRTTAAAEPSWAAASAEVEARARAAGRQPRARNVILFIGDGMGISTVTAARIFEAQQRAKAAGGSFPGFGGGEENRLVFERFPHAALVKTYNTNAQVPDSAGTATAMTTGTKTRIGVLGLLPGQGPETCRTPEAFPKPLARLARESGLAVGIVTTTRITHATPAAMFAHVPNRDWEAADRDYPVEARASGCPDIAAQLTGFSGGLDVALGGGLARFRPVSAGGTRDDGRDLIAEWQKADPRARFVGDSAGLSALDPAAPGPVLGLFNPSHLDFAFDADRTKEPSLADMTRFAIRKLAAESRRRPGRGYVLMVEGGRIDHAHHLTNAYRALDETVEFARAIEAAQALVDPRDTLILVTADHSHVFTIAGYPPRGNPILGFLRPIPGGEGRTRTDADGNALDEDGRPITTLGYANGPASVRIGERTLDSNRAPTDPDYLQAKTHRLMSETHGGEDVGLWATGPGSALVSGTLEQNAIFHVIARALGWR
ncbi:MAG: alkaline phosphatase [Sphingomonadaceae bacterium]